MASGFVCTLSKCFLCLTFISDTYQSSANPIGSLPDPDPAFSYSSQSVQNAAVC